MEGQQTGNRVRSKPLEVVFQLGDTPAQLCNDLALGKVRLVLKPAPHLHVKPGNEKNLQRLRRLRRLGRQVPNCANRGIAHD